MEPWSFEPEGRFEEHTIESQALSGNPLGDPDSRPLWVYLPPGYDDGRRAAVPVGLHDPGPDRPARHVAEPLAVPAQLPGARGRPVRPGRRAARDRRLGRLLDLARWQPVPRLAGDGQLPDLSLRRDRALRRRALPHDRRLATIAGSRASRAAATARWWSRCSARTCGAGSPRTPATRCSRPATCRSSESRPASSATSTRGRSTRSGRTSGAGPPCRSPATAIS